MITNKEISPATDIDCESVNAVSVIAPFNNPTAGIFVMDKRIKHGLSGHRLHSVWLAMINRCYNKNVANYHRYGGRGINVCNEWLHDFRAYYDHVMSLPNAMADGLSLDRERNDKGYEPGNMRWETCHIQAVNQGMKKNNTSGYTGVSFNKRENKWSSNIRVNGKLFYLGDYKSKKDAVNARNKYIIINNLTEYKTQHYD